MFAYRPVLIEFPTVTGFSSNANAFFYEAADAVRQNKIDFFIANPVASSSLSAEEWVRPLATLENLQGSNGDSVF